jgi:hypothetical protein
MNVLALHTSCTNLNGRLEFGRLKLLPASRSWAAAESW